MPRAKGLFGKTYENTELRDAMENPEVVETFKGFIDIYGLKENIVNEEDLKAWNDYLKTLSVSLGLSVSTGNTIITKLSKKNE